MNELAIELRGGVTAYRPGGSIEGTVSWSFDKPPRAVELRLFWYTRGFGTEDAEVVEKQSFDGEQEQGRHSFALRLPSGPYSFRGTLITLVWALELVGPHGTLARTEFSMGPEGRPVELMP